MTTSKKSGTRPSPPLRFAHPFYTLTPPRERSAYPGAGHRLRDYIEGTLHAVPPTRGDGSMKLDRIIGPAGVKEIETAGKICFHAVGDTGRKPDSPEQMVGDAMAQDYDVTRPGNSPAFFLHLGDVIYGHDKDQSYRREFYEPYMRYPGKIIAIPGNHDGETFPGTDPVSLRAFRNNFCTQKGVVPPIAGSIFRQTMTQPGVYWFLDAPFLDIIGLYSNSAENPGFISGKIPGSNQKRWLVSCLKHIGSKRSGGTRKALVLATHHPPYSSGGHSGSSEMLADIDEACRQAGVFPDMFLSGHAHSYQRYTRSFIENSNKRRIPFIVAGTGGISEQEVPAANGQTVGDATYDSSRKGYGFLLISAGPSSLEAEFFAVTDGIRTSFDKVSMHLT